MPRIGKPQKSKKHKKLKQVSDKYLALWGGKSRGRSGINTGKQTSAALPTKINSAPNKPSEQEIPRSLQELMAGKLQVGECRRKNRKRKRDILEDTVYEDQQQKGMTRPVEEVPEFKRKLYETDKDFIQRVEVQCKNFIDKRKFEVAHEIIKPDDDPAFKEDKQIDKKLKTPDNKKQLKLENVKAPDIKKQLKLENVNVPRSTSNNKKKNKTKAAKKKNKTGFERFSDKVKFGEVVMEPPKLSARPRGAALKNGPEQKVPDLILLNKLQGTTKLDLTVKRKELPLATRHKLDTERDRVVELYRLMKEKKLQER